MSFADFPEPRGMAVNPSFSFRIDPKERRGDENEESLCPKWFLAFQAVLGHADIQQPGRTLPLSAWGSRGTAHKRRRRSWAECGVPHETEFMYASNQTDQCFQWFTEFGLQGPSWGMHRCLPFSIPLNTNGL